MFGLMDFYYLLIMGSINTMFQRYSDILFNQSDNMLTVHGVCKRPSLLRVPTILMLSSRVCVHQPKRVGAQLCANDAYSSIDVIMLVGVFI